jgi:BirA family biotin operon repressor/biotin-[acetyl-CoA-carboxylase] ligase
VVGLGVNVHLTTAELPVPEATSLALLRPEATFARAEIAATILAALALLYHRWEAGRDADLRTEYLARCETFGRSVRVLQPDGSSVQGEAVDVDAAGQLRVRTDGGVEVFAAGDVLHLR